ncbi:MAG: DUF3021 domain-containing protein [Clostridioides sp.]|jgi:hypothetical protein|nr:DUF3021 domain-containing protein [Clostridioides sp.]
MSKLVIRKIGLGIVIGNFIGTILALIFSYASHSNSFSPSSPEFIKLFSTELNAMSVSIVLWSLLGITFTLSSLIFTETEWSITKMTVIHFCITYFIFMPLAICAGWFPLSIWSVLVTTIIFIFIYFVIWSISIRIARKEIFLLNGKLK